MADKMQVIELRGGFGMENVRLAERDKPDVGPGQVRVKLEAASLNYRDLLTVRGLYNPKLAMPMIPCSDGAGVVEAVGAGVKQWREGDRVCGIFAQAWQSGEPTREKLASTLGGPLDGTLCEYRTFEQDGLVRVPQHLTSEQAATLPCAAVTAWRALTDHGGVLPGQTVLVQGSGGVSIFALQFAVMMGLRVIATTSTEQKRLLMQALGAEHTINYVTQPDWGKAARDYTKGRGVDVIVEVGGTGTLAQSLRAIRPGGRVSVIGVLSGGVGELSLFPVLMQDVRLQGIVVGAREHFEAMNRAIERAIIRPLVDRSFPMAQTLDAMAHLASGSHMGKVAITIGK